MRLSICCFLILLQLRLTAQSFSGPAGERFSMRVVASHLSDPWEVLLGPDKSLWVTESKSYRVLRVDPATGHQEVVLDLSAEREFPRYDRMQEETGHKPWPQGGLAGLAVHPRLLQDKPFVYLSYVYRFRGAADTGRGCALNHGGCFFTARIVRYTYNSETRKLEQPEILCDSIPSSSDHNGARMVLVPEKGKWSLFYSIGDMGAGQFDNAGRTNHAQETGSYEGKILRFNAEPDADPGPYDRWIPNDNPFNAATQNAVYSYGHRNPQGLVFGTIGGVGRLYESEHGPYSDDEINVIEKGKNYGHPLVIGAADGNYDGLAASVSTFEDVPGKWHTTYPLIGREKENARKMGNLFKGPLNTYYPNSPAFLQDLFNQISKGNDRPEWPSEAPSSIDLYTSSAIPGWQHSLLLPSLKHGHLVRVKLNGRGDAIAGDTLMYFTLPVRYRDLAISEDGRKIYLCTDSAAVSSGPSSQNPQQVSYGGSILEFTYEGMGPGKGTAAGKTAAKKEEGYGSLPGR